jgi:type I restriction enzyme M protein
MARSSTVTDILKGTDYGLKAFSDVELRAIKLFDKGDKPYLTCAVSDKPRPAKPEEIVRQLYLNKLMSEYGYPKDRITLVKSVQFGSSVHDKAADIVIFEKGAPTTPYIIVECKKPKRKDGLEQLESYCNATGAPIGVWTNGGAVVVRHRKDPNLFDDLTDLPRADQTLADLLKQPWTLEDLKRENILVNERTSLKDIVLEIEDLFLANSGGDAFEEVFKLIYAKLFDEWQAARKPKGRQHLDFRVGIGSDREVCDPSTGSSRGP